MLRCTEKCVHDQS